MKQRRRNGDELYLPEEIIRNILKRLPVKSLTRFQCVCKYWRNLVKNPSFIADHLQQSSHQNPSLLIEYNRGNIDSRWRWRWPLHFLDCSLQVRKVQKAPLIDDSLEGARIVGSCNGLLLFEIGQNNNSLLSLSLWNPATTAARHVPLSRTDCFDAGDYVTGFGFSPIVNDYKIVRTFAKIFDSVRRVEVFSLSRGSWRGIHVSKLERVRLDCEPVTASGAIFWTGLKLGAVEVGEDDVEVIVSFDVAKEVFTVIPLPHLDYDDAFSKLIVYENKPAMLCDIWEDGDETHVLIGLWVLDEDTYASGETWSWTKRYISSPVSCTLDSRAIWRNEIVCIDNEGRKNVLYMMNLTTNEGKRFVFPNCDRIYDIYNYVESLVSVGNNYIEES